MTPAGRPASTDGIAISVHGPLGVLDLAVPRGAVAVDLAREYAEKSGLGSVPILCTRLGAPLAPDASLASAGVESGAVLVAVTPGPLTSGAPFAAPPGAPPGAPARRPVLTRSVSDPGALSVLWFTVASGVATLAGWCAARSDPSLSRTLAIDLLLLSALLGVLPRGRFAAHRALAAPAFGAAAAFAAVWDPAPERLPVVLGIAALAAAVTAAVARSLDEQVEEGLRVWMVGGAVVFVVSGIAALAGLGAVVVWSVLLVGAMLAARFVPGLAIDVPDQLLIDLERLAVTAWSARDQAPGRRGRAVASPAAVAVVATRGARLVTAACAAIAVVAVVSAGLLIHTVTVDLDRTGARCLVFFAGGALLLAGRSHRHAGARGLLRVAGLGCWGWLAAGLLTGAGPVVVGAGVATGTGIVLLLVAVATGRGWRSAWWARRAEVAEGLCGSAALASVLVATGLFRTVWDIGSRVGA